MVIFFYKFCKLIVVVGIEPTHAGINNINTMQDQLTTTTFNPTNPRLTVPCSAYMAAVIVGIEPTHVNT